MGNTAEAQDLQQFLTFRLGAETYAVDVHKVREILDQVVITRMPQMPDEMLGVINLRGQVVPVVDLRRTFGLAAEETNRDNCVVVLEVDCAGEQLVVGARADAVQEVLDLSQAAIEPPPRLGLKLKTEFIRGMGKKDDAFLIILDVDRIFSDAALAQLQESACA
jgi:purine-binding chemotaxis protein CheW